MSARFRPELIALLRNMMRFSPWAYRAAWRPPSSIYLLVYGPAYRRGPLGTLVDSATQSKRLG